MIGIIDYDAGNIKSVEKALAYLGEETVVSRDPQVLLRADKVILPGVGSFGEAMENLHKYGLVPVIQDMIKKGTPFLGICLGLQLLFESSFDLCSKEINLVGSWVYTLRDYATTFDFLKRAKAIGLPMSDLITDRFPLEQINEAHQTNLAMTGLKIAIINK